MVTDGRGENVLRTKGARTTTLIPTNAMIQGTAVRTGYI